jgi:hypothetical protein
MFFQLRLAFTAPVQLVLGNNSASEDIRGGEPFLTALHKRRAQRSYELRVSPLDLRLRTHPSSHHQ